MSQSADSGFTIIAFQEFLQEWSEAPVYSHHFCSNSFLWIIYPFIHLQGQQLVIEHRCRHTILPPVQSQRASHLDNLCTAMLNAWTHRMSVWDAELRLSGR
jgi:hypothetical protein